MYTLNVPVVPAVTLVFTGNTYAANFAVLLNDRLLEQIQVIDVVTESEHVVQ